VGAHTRVSGRHAKVSGRHRGEPAPLFEGSLDLGKLGATAGVLAAAAGTAVALAPAASAAPTGPRAASVATAPSDDFARLRACESGGRYATNTGNGFYGAYQFDVRTWRGLGYGGLPSQAAPAVQDAAAAQLQAERGWSPWPACSAKLGLGGGAAGSSFSGVAVGSGFNPFGADSAGSVSASSDAADAEATVVPTTPPAFDAQALPNKALDGALVDAARPDVKLWQERMKARGWDIKVDGFFGPKSAAIAAAFAREKSITSGALGAVDAAMWNAAWQLPVT
jgi:hypothetical protein